VGILVQGATNNQISGNIIDQNTEWGLQLNATQKDNQIFGNSISDNNLEGGFQVSIPMCMIVERKSEVTISIVPGLGNNWNSGFVGNYWSDYQTRYPNAEQVDGVWQTPFYINENNIDQYPLVNPPPQNAASQPASPKQTNPEDSLTTIIFYYVVGIAVLLVVFVCFNVVLRRRRGVGTSASNLIYLQHDPH
jgi:parallel beta-helix repeat protein